MTIVEKGVKDEGQTFDYIIGNPPNKQVIRIETRIDNNYQKIEIPIIRRRWWAKKKTKD